MFLTRRSALSHLFSYQSKIHDFSYLTQRCFNSAMIKHRQTFALLALKIHSSVALGDRMGASFISRRAYPTMFPSTGCFEHFTKFIYGSEVQAACISSMIIHNFFHLSFIIYIILFWRWKWIMWICITLFAFK